jgi:predicted MFS family arabinose efflux permease
LANESSSVSPTGDTGAHDAARLGSGYWMQHRDKLFVASCIALIVTAMSFAIRGDTMGDVGTHFNFSKEDLGKIGGIAFLGFTLAMVGGGPLCDVLGMGRLLALAVFGHGAGIILSIVARDYNMFFFGTLLIGLGNGLVEAACNPLIATLYPDQKIKKLNQFHMWFPGGIVIGGLVSYAITQANISPTISWQIKLGTMLLPLAIYAFLFLGKKFPQTERVASNVTTGQMFAACLSPMFLLFVVCMLMTAATELVTGQWLPDILTVTTGISGILFLVLINGLMAAGRGAAGVVVHRLSPIAILVASSLFSAIGLFLLTRANNAATGFLGAVVFAVGVCFYWPTMLGVVSERFPKTGALGLAIMGGAGNLSVAAFMPFIGKVYDQGTATAAGSVDALKALQSGGEATKAKLTAVQAAGGQAALSSLLALPVILLVVFAAIYMYDNARGGYKEEVLVQHQEGAETATA